MTTLNQLMEVLKSHRFSKPTPVYWMEETDTPYVVGVYDGKAIRFVTRWSDLMDADAHLAALAEKSREGSLVTKH